MKASFDEMYNDIMQNIQKKAAATFDMCLQSTTSTNLDDQNQSSAISTAYEIPPKDSLKATLDEKISNTDLNYFVEKKHLLESLIDKLNKLPPAKCNEKLREMNAIACFDVFVDDVGRMMTIPAKCMDSNAKMEETIRHPGRPKSKKRLRPKDEKPVKKLMQDANKRSKFTCSKCHQTGHNKKTCLSSS